MPTWRKELPQETHVFAHCSSLSGARASAQEVPAAKNRSILLLMMPFLLSAFVACNRETALSERPSSPEGVSTLQDIAGRQRETLDAQLDRRLKRGMKRSEAFATIEVSGTAGGPSGMLWSASRVVCDEYPGKSIDLFFEYDDDNVPRLTDWKLRDRVAMEFYLPTEDRTR